MKSKDISIFAKSALAAAIVGAISVAPNLVDVADAATLGRVTASTSFSSATFRLYATLTAGGAVTGSALTLSNSNAKQFYYIRNTGSMQINSYTMTVTGSASGSSFTYRRCDANVAFTAADTCASGTPTTFTLTSNVATLTIPAGTNFHIQITPNKTTTPTINISVARSQVIAGATSNS